MSGINESHHYDRRDTDLFIEVLNSFRDGRVRKSSEYHSPPSGNFSTIQGATGHSQAVIMPIVYANMQLPANACIIFAWCYISCPPSMIPHNGARQTPDQSSKSRTRNVVSWSCFWQCAKLSQNPTSGLCMSHFPLVWEPSLYKTMAAEHVHLTPHLSRVPNADLRCCSNGLTSKALD